MRVVIVAESFLPRVNGVSGSVLRATRHLISQGHDVHIIAPDPAPSTTPEGVQVHAVKSFSVPGMGVDVGYALASTLRQVLQQLRPDVVHLASPLILGYQAMRAASWLGLPTVAVFQTDISGFARHYRLAGVGSLSDAVLRRIHKEADLTLVPSSASLEYLRHLGVDRVAMWGRGVDAEQFDPRNRCPELRTRWLSPHPDRVVVGYVGRLAPEKRVDILRSIRHDPRIKLVVIGDGPQREELQTLLPQAHFTGMLRGPELGIAVASLDILVAPGERETFCQVIQEGMASGLAVIAPDIGGPRDLVVHAEVGLRYRPGDDEHFATCVDALVASPAARAVMGASARSMIRDRTWTRIGDDLVGHYRSVLRGMDVDLVA
ncbi:MAG TPA: glycosyltransferase family 1 protein [Candidatus Nanopelagicales bacterium]|nr:glycosyltransferase family 1 protein [Candidatus Nanopelagicales bacterium]